MVWLLCLRWGLLRGKRTEGMGNGVIDKRIECNKIHDISYSMAISAEAMHRSQHVNLRLM